MNLHDALESLRELSMLEGEFRHTAKTSDATWRPHYDKLADDAQAGAYRVMGLIRAAYGSNE